MDRLLTTADVAEICRANDATVRSPLAEETHEAPG